MEFNLTHMISYYTGSMTKISILSDDIHLSRSTTIQNVISSFLPDVRFVSACVNDERGIYIDLLSNRSCESESLFVICANDHTFLAHPITIVERCSPDIIILPDKETGQLCWQICVSTTSKTFDMADRDIILFAVFLSIFLESHPFWSHSEMFDFFDDPSPSLFTEYRQRSAGVWTSYQDSQNAHDCFQQISYPLSPGSVLGFLPGSEFEGDLCRQYQDMLNPHICGFIDTHGNVVARPSFNTEIRECCLCNFSDFSRTGRLSSDFLKRSPSIRLIGCFEDVWTYDYTDIVQTEEKFTGFQTPLILIVGSRRFTGKFETQLALTKRFRDRGMRVLNITFNPAGVLFDMICLNYPKRFIIPDMSHSIRSFIHRLDQIEPQYDAILFSLGGGMFDRYGDHFSALYSTIANSISVDYIVLCTEYNISEKALHRLTKTIYGRCYDHFSIVRSAISHYERPTNYMVYRESPPPAPDYDLLFTELLMKLGG